MISLFLEFLPFVLVVYGGSLCFTWLTYGRTIELERYFVQRSARIKWYFLQEIKVLMSFLLYGSMIIFALDILKPRHFWTGLIGLVTAFGFGYLRAYFYEGDLAIRAFTNVLKTVFCSRQQKRFRLQWLKRKS